MSSGDATGRATDHVSGHEVAQARAEEVEPMRSTGYLDRDTATWLDALNSADPLERRLGAYALGQIGRADIESVEALRSHLTDEVSFVRAWAAASLARVEPADDGAFATLERATTDELDFVRSLAAWLLGRVALPDHVERCRGAVRPLLDDPAQSVRAEAAQALDRLERLERGLPAS